VFKFTSTNTNVTTSEINAIPIPIATDEVMLKVAELVDQIINFKKVMAKTKDLEAQIDIIVYKLYKLYNFTASEVNLIDPDFALTEPEYGAIEIA
jgi:hypothetical protein